MDSVDFLFFRCAGNGYTSRWYHLSQAEHYCNECFDHYYRRFVLLEWQLLVWWLYMYWYMYLTRSRHVLVSDQISACTGIRPDLTKNHFSPLYSTGKIWRGVIYITTYCSFIGIVKTDNSYLYVQIWGSKYYLFSVFFQKFNHFNLLCIKNIGWQDLVRYQKFTKKNKFQ